MGTDGCIRPTRGSCWGLMLQSSFPAGFQWHWKVHLGWGRESLVFMFLDFLPTYDRVATVAGLQAFMEEQGVLSYSFYELSAPHDVLVRAWLPRGKPSARLQMALDKSWPKEHPVNAPVVLEVEQILHHWPWQPNDRSEVGEMERPPTETLKEGRPVRELHILNDVQRAASLAGSSLPGGGGSFEGPGRQSDPSEVGNLVKEYKGLHLITEPAYDPGIRFLILVEAENAREDLAARRRLGTSLGELLNRAQNGSGQAGPRIWDRSLYSTNGKYPFVILGRVDESPGHFHSIASALVTEINDRLAAAGARTHTSFFPLPGFLDFRDELRISSRPEPDAPDAAELLGRQESRTLEVKGSAFSELSEFLKERTDQAEISTDIDNKALSSLLRAVVSMLNAPESSYIVVGAVEAKKYKGSKRVEDLPTQGNFKVWGIEHDLNGSDWDRYTRRLEQALESRISPNPMWWIRLSPSSVTGGKMVCVVSVSLPDEWFHGTFRGKSGGGEEEHFIVRGSGAGASTNSLEPGEVEKYKERTPRSPRRPADEKQ